MGIKKYITNKFLQNPIIKDTIKENAKALFLSMSNMQPTIYNVSYNGEKNAGELGSVKNYTPDFQTLSARSWQAYTESDVAQLIVHNFLLWTIGSGLKYKAEPQKEILSQNGLNLDIKEFIKLSENRFNLYMDTKRSTTNRMKTFHQLVWEIKKHAIVGGDSLVILDYGRKEDKNKAVCARLIDSWNITSPLTNDVNSNKIINGIEINEYGETVAFWVCNGVNDYKRIAAYNQNGTIQAFLVYGLEYRVDNRRGIPLLSVILESISKLDRYKEATVGTAEEVAKMTFVVEHSQYSTGEDPLSKMKAIAGHGDIATEQITNDLLAKTASNIAFTTGKTSLNAPIGATIKTLDNKNQLNFKDFYLTNFDVICATMGIPPEVALNKYTTSFSSSMGAKGNWQYRVNFEREKDSINIYQPFFNYWLEMEIMNNNISVNGYMTNKLQDNFMIIEALRKSRFIGTKIPFIDPLKEIKAIRAKLGEDKTPLITYEQAAEDANENGIDFNTMIEQASVEYEKAKPFQERQEPLNQPINE